MKSSFALVAWLLVNVLVCVKVSFAQTSHTSKLLDPIRKHVPIENKCIIIFPSESTITAITGHLVKLFYSYQKQNHPDLQVIYVLEGLSVNHQNIKKYFKDIYKIDSLYANDHIIIDSAIFNMQPKEIINEGLSGIVFVVDQQIRYMSPLKLTNADLVFKQAKFYVGLGKSQILPLLPDVFHEKMDRYNFVNTEKMITIKNTYDLELFDSNTGELLKRYERKEFNSLEIFSKYFAKDQKEIDFARERHEFFERTNRPEVHCYWLNADEHSIWLLAAACVVKTQNKDFQAGGKMQKAGTPVVMNHAFFAQFDHSLNLLKIHPIDPTCWVLNEPAINNFEFVYDYDKKTMTYINYASKKDKVVSVFKLDPKERFVFSHLESITFKQLGVDSKDVEEYGELAWVRLGKQLGILDYEQQKIFNSQTGQLIYQLNKGIYLQDKTLDIREFRQTADQKYLAVFFKADNSFYVDLVDLQTNRLVKRTELLLDIADMYKDGDFIYDGKKIIMYYSTYGQMILKTFELEIDPERGY